MKVQLDPGILYTLLAKSTVARFPWAKKRLSSQVKSMGQILHFSGAMQMTYMMWIKCRATDIDCCLICHTDLCATDLPPGRGSELY